MAIQGNTSEFGSLANGTSTLKNDPTSGQTNTLNQNQVNQNTTTQASATTSYTPGSVQTEQPYNQGTQQNQWSGDESNQGRGLFNFLNGLDVPYNVVSGRVSEFHNAFIEAAKEITILEHNKNYWDFLVFDGQSNQSVASALLFVRRDPDSKVAAVYAYITQDVNVSLPEKQHQTRNFNGQPITINVPQLTEELITSDSFLSSAILSFVSSQYVGRDVSEFFFAGGRVLPQELDPKNKREIIRALFYGNAATQTILGEINNNDFNFNLTWKKSDENFRIKVDYNAGQVVDSVGFPKRSDLLINFFLQKYNHNQNNQYQDSIGQIRQVSFSGVSAFINFTLNENGAMMLNQSVPFGQQPQFKAPWEPSIVITAINNQFDKASLSTQLLALSSTFVMTNQAYFMEALRPNYSITKPGEDPRDIGNLTKLWNFPGYDLDFTNTKLKDFNLLSFMQTYVNSNMKFFIDIEEAGDMTYIQRVFIEAAGYGVSPEVQNTANARIFSAAMQLTNGAFAKFWEPHNGEQFFYSEVGRIEHGYYYDDKNNIRDLRDIDALMVATNMDQDTALNFLDSFNFEIYPDEMMRFSIRNEIYRHHFSTYHITGFARRLTINPNFVKALSDAIRQIVPNIATDQQWFGGQQINRGYMNQIGGVPMNSLNMFTANGYSYNGRPSNTQWRTYQTNPTMSINGGGYGYGAGFNR